MFGTDRIVSSVADEERFDSCVCNYNSSASFKFVKSSDLTRLKEFSNNSAQITVQSFSICTVSIIRYLLASFNGINMSVQGKNKGRELGAIKFVFKLKLLFFVKYIWLAGGHSGMFSS